MKVSVVMPTRNAEATLEAAIESILSQTCEDFEFVIVDHNSTDRTPAILNEATSRDQRIRVHRSEGTFVEAANRAWQVASGDVIARMDSDDVAHPERIQRQVDFLKNHRDIAACGTLVHILCRGPEGESGPADDGYQRYEQWVNSVVSPGEIMAQRFVDSPLPNPTAMIRREALESLGGYRDPAWAEDYDFWLRLLEAGHSLGKVDAVLLNWFDAPDRSTRTIERYNLSRFQEAKAHFLARIHKVQDLGVTLCGAGPIGKEMARFLTSEGISVTAFCEVNERQIGNLIGGAPVLGADAIPDLKNKTVLLGAVGQPGARDRIRNLAVEAGFLEGSDFFCIA